MSVHTVRLPRLATASVVGPCASDWEVGVRIRARFTRARERYGSPRIHDDLREAGVPVSRNRVACLMRQAGLLAARASVTARRP